MNNKIIICAEEEVVCSKCSHAFPLHEGIARQTIDRYAQEFEDEAKSYREQLANDAAKDAERRLGREFADKIVELQDQVAASKRSEREARDAIERARTEAREKAVAEADQERKVLVDEVERKAAELQELRAQELELRRERQALEDKQRNLDLEVQRRIDEERSLVAKREADRFAMIEGELRKKIEDAQSANDLLRRKLEQGSQQLQGEVLELEVEQSLASTFFHDLIEEVKKGQRGADVIQSVRTPTGVVAGKIIWEAKRAENWSEKWLDKLKDDQQEAQADLAVLVTTAMPRGLIGPFARMGGVWIVSPQALLPMAETLRVIVLEIHKVRQANSGRDEKVELLYNYLASPVFSQRMRAVLECFVVMQGDLDAEKRAIQRLWAKRQMQIARVSKSMSSVIGELQAIAQDSLPELTMIDTLALPEPGTDEV